jgi:hypothetical protein
MRSCPSPRRTTRLGGGVPGWGMGAWERLWRKHQGFAGGTQPSRSGRASYPGPNPTPSPKPCPPYPHPPAPGPHHHQLLRRARRPAHREQRRQAGGAPAADGWQGGDALPARAQRLPAHRARQGVGPPRLAAARRPRCPSAGCAPPVCAGRPALRSSLAPRPRVHAHWPPMPPHPTPSRPTTPKAMFVDFGMAARYGGVCYLRYDDTNPNAEKQARGAADGHGAPARRLPTPNPTPGPPNPTPPPTPTPPRPQPRTPKPPPPPAPNPPPRARAGVH